ncbi:MAG: EthD family reductase [Anaerolineae bacterium]|nr:EthD family reductase [Anaerolineae bacterium]
MFKFVTLYRRVDDEAVLEEFFSNTHLQLAEQLPGLLRSEVGRIRGKPGGESRYHLMYALYFDSRQLFLQALASEPGIALIAALQPWAEARLITWFYADAFSEPPA